MSLGTTRISMACVALELSNIVEETGSSFILLAWSDESGRPSESAWS